MNSQPTQNDSMLPLMVDIWQQTLNWQPDEKQQQQFQQLYSSIVAGNRQLNLTRITEPKDFWEKHLWDSLRGIAPFLGNPLPITNDQLPITNPQVIDIGTGAGFPGVPCAIAHPHWQVTLLDSTRKKIAFLDTLLAQIGLPNAKTLLGRSEQINQKSQHRKTYDLALIRAVGAASLCAEYALPFLKVGGLAILYRGHWTDEEAADLQPVIQRLSSKLESIEPFTTPLSQSVRHCLYLRKLG
jgi:16S rRNA (guanine527-N7)-methyltransferase